MKIRIVLLTTVLAAVAIASDSKPTIAPVAFKYPAWDMGGTMVSTLEYGKRYDVQPPKPVRGPRWENGKSNPPLSVSEAIKLASKSAKGIVKERDRLAWGLTGATLVPWDSANGYWYWRVKFEQRLNAPGGFSGPTPTLFVIVLMDGSVVVPQR